MTFANNLSARFKTEWINEAKFKPMYAAMLEALSTAESIEAKAAEIRKSGELTPSGSLKAMRAFVSKEPKTALKAVADRVDSAAKATAAKRRKMSIPPINPDDRLASEHRQEARRMMQTMDAGALAELLVNDPELLFLQAAFEVPARMVSPHLNDDLKQRVERAWLEQNAPEMLAEVEDQEQVVELVEVALQHAIGTMKTAAGFEGDDAGFNAFMAGEAEPFKTAA